MRRTQKWNWNLDDGAEYTCSICSMGSDNHNEIIAHFDLVHDGYDRACSIVECEDCDFKKVFLPPEDVDGDGYWKGKVMRKAKRSGASHIGHYPSHSYTTI